MNKVSRQKIKAHFNFSKATLLWVWFQTIYTHFLFSSFFLDDGVSRSYGMDYVSPVTPITVEYIFERVLDKV